MPDSFAKTIFPKQYSKIEKARQSVMSRPLRMKEINTLMSLRFNGTPLFDSIDHFSLMNTRKLSNRTCLQSSWKTGKVPSCHSQ